MLIKNKKMDSIIDIIKSALEDKDHLLMNLSDTTNDSNIYFNEITKQVYELTDAELVTTNTKSPYYGFCFDINCDIYFMNESETKIAINVNIAKEQFSGSKKEYVVYKLEKILKNLYQASLAEKNDKRLVTVSSYNLHTASYRLLQMYTLPFETVGYIENITWLKWLSTHYQNLINFPNDFEQIVYKNSVEKDSVIDDQNIMNMLVEIEKNNNDKKIQNAVRNFIKKSLYNNPKQISKLKMYQNNENIKNMIFDYLETDCNITLSRLDKTSLFIACTNLDTAHKYTMVLNVSPMVKLSKPDKINTLPNLHILYDLNDLSFLNNRTNVLKYIDEIKKLNQFYMLKSDFSALTKIKEAYELIDFTSLDGDSQYKILWNELNILLKKNTLILINSVSDLSDKKLIISTLTD